MANNPTYCKYVLVFGRRAEYEENEQRRRIVKSYEEDDFKIITFDSLISGSNNMYPLSIGSRHNEYIDIITDDIIDPGLYSWMEASQLRVSKTLHSNLENAPPSQHFVNFGGKFVDALKQAAPLVRVRPD